MVSQYHAIDLQDFLVIAEAVLGVPAEQLRHAARLSEAESALAAPFAVFGDTQTYPTAVEKAAILCSRLVRNHPLPDGNKRVAYLSMREFMMREDVAWKRPGDDEIVEKMEGLAARSISEEDFVEWVRSHT